MADGGMSPVTTREGTGVIKGGSTAPKMPEQAGKRASRTENNSRRPDDTGVLSRSSSTTEAGSAEKQFGKKSVDGTYQSRPGAPVKITDIPLPSLPPPGAGASGLVPPLSNSLPSTPYIHARKLSDEYRTPPAATYTAQDAGSTPRSVRSESDGGSNVRSTARATSVSASSSRSCRFETGMAFSRRRVPYSLGGDVLEPATKVKKALDTDEEKQLTADMRELYSRLLPTADSEKRRGQLVNKLQRILNEKWPGQDIKVHVFGSSGNLLCHNESDVDVCITTTLKSLDRMCNLAKVLADRGMERVVCVPHARVPIVKIWDPELKLSCDMNVNNTLAMVNTRMIRAYVELDPRVRPLAMVIKHWTRKRVLNDAALGGTLSSYTWICMILNFLQTRNPPVLPNLQAGSQEQKSESDEPVPVFDEDLNKYVGFGDKNKESIGELVFHFFRRYGYEIDFEKNVISIRAGNLISKVAKKWHLMQNNRLCVEEPFNTNRNLGNTADDISFRGVHLELRRAFDLLSQAKLEECCEEYVFPPPEEKTWIKPAPQPRPVLTRSLSQQGRATRSTTANTAGGRQPNKSRTGPSNRRASSAAAMNKLPPFSAGPSSAPLQMPHDRLSGSQIHAHLIHHFQLLQAQEQQLRQHMQERAQQAQLSARVAAHLQPIQIPGSAMPQQAGFEGLRVPNTIDPAPMSAPLRGMQGGYYPFHLTPQLPSHRFPPQTMTPNQSSTNPPSPTMSSGQSASASRTHRGMSANEDSSSIRSQSQPPGNSLRGGRTLRHPGGQNPQNIAHNPHFGHPALAQFQHLYLQAKISADAQFHQPPRQQQQAQQQQQQLHHHRSHTHSPQADSPGLRSMHMEQQVDAHGRLIGYGFDPAMQYAMQMNGADLNLMNFSRQGGEGANVQGRPRRASVSPQITRVRSHTPRSGSPPNNNGVPDLRINQSPSASLSQGTSRSASMTNTETPVSPPAPQQPAQKCRSGPLIVDGSADTDYTPPRETASWMNGQMEGLSLSSDLGGQGLAFSPSPNMSTPPPSSSAPRTPPPHPSTMLQFGDFPARATLRSTGRASKSSNEQSNEAKAMAFPKVAIPDRATPFAAGLGIEIAGEELKSSTAKTEAQRTSNSEIATSQAGFGASSSHPDADERGSAFLSPVREVRTPSPTVTRASQLHNRPSSESTDARHVRGRQSVGSPTPRPSNTVHEPRLQPARQLSPVKNGVVQASANQPSASGNSTRSPAQGRPISFDSLGGSQPVPAPLQTGGWQHSVSKKSRKSRKPSSTGTATLVSEVERKGG